MLEKILF